MKQKSFTPPGSVVATGGRAVYAVHTSSSKADNVIQITVEETNNGVTKQTPVIVKAAIIE